MSNPNLTARKQAELAASRIRGAGRSRLPVDFDSVRSTATSAVTTNPATGILRRVIDVPEPPSVDPAMVATRQLDRGGRFRWEAVSKVGRAPGEVLTARVEGDWLVVSAGPGPAKASQRVTWDANGRVKIPHGLQSRIGWRSAPRWWSASTWRPRRWRWRRRAGVATRRLTSLLYPQ